MKVGKNSMFYWWPLVKGLPINTPETIMIPLEGEIDFHVIDGKPDPVFDCMVDKAIQAAEKLGYPVFVRSDELSNKFEWEDSCYVTKSEDMGKHICNILEATAMSMGPRFNGVAVREFLHLDWKFKAMYGKMPVAREFRMFVQDGKLKCWHPYWPPASIEEPTIEDWREVLKEMQTPTEGELQILTKLAETIGEAVGGYWSVDLCQTKDSSWYLTDMALGPDSYHWATCQNASPDMLAHYGDPDGAIRDRKAELEKWKADLETWAEKEDA